MQTSFLLLIQAHFRRTKLYKGWVSCYLIHDESGTFRRPIHFAICTRKPASEMKMFQCGWFEWMFSDLVMCANIYKFRKISPRENAAWEWCFGNKLACVAGGIVNTSKVMGEELWSCGEWWTDVLMAALPPKLSHSRIQFHQLSRLGIESSRFEEQNEYEHDI